MQWQKLVVFTLFCGTALPGGTIHLKTRTIDTANLPADYQAQPSTKRWRAGVSHYLVQFRAPVSDNDRDALAQHGAVITASVPDNAVMVAAGDDFTTEGLNVEYAGRLQPQDKLSPTVQDASDSLTMVVEFHGDVDPADAQALLSEQQLTLLAHPNLAWTHFLVTGKRQAVLDLQSWDEVDYLFPASADLTSGQAVHLCESALSTDGNNTGQYAVVGHGWPKDSSGKATVGYFFSALTGLVPAATVKAQVLLALNAWTAYAPLKFQPGAGATALQTINVWFASGDHGDGFPFSSEVLAHTFYPSNPEPIAGDMHFNMDQAWHSGNNVDIYTVALHEAGHALGLGHSDQPGAVMYPYYRLGAQIAAADIAGIQSLYGAVTAAPVAPPAIPLTVTVNNLAATTAAASIAVSGTTANGIGTTVVTWQTDQKATGQAVGGATWSVAAVPLVVGTNTITMTATDGNHRQAVKAITVTRSAPPAAATTTSTPTTPAPGATAPIIAIASPAMTIVQTNQASIPVSGTASATAAKVTWQNGPLGTGVATGISNWTANVPLLTGTNTVIVKAIDAAGNSAWRSLTVVRR